MTYLLRHWKALTLFLRQAGTPLDNNIVERGLKRAILHRKNALFYRTLNGAQVGDLFMTLIHTAELSGANSLHYLTELQRHAAELADRPAEWMPWNYSDTLARTALSNMLKVAIQPVVIDVEQAGLGRNWRFAQSRRRT